METFETEANMSDADKVKYLPKYNAREENEAVEDTQRDLAKMDIVEDQINEDKSQGFEDATTAAEGTGANLQSGLFGMLTQSSQKSAQQNFAGAGDFGAQFDQEQLVEGAEREFEGAETERNRTVMDANAQLSDIAIDREQLTADAQSGIQDLHDDYNDEFWGRIFDWDTAING